MKFPSRFAERATEEELMDRPDCDERRLVRTLDQFHDINRLFSRVRGLLKRTVLADMVPGRDYRLLDLGAGACDIPVWLLGEAGRRGLSLAVTAVDADPRVVRYARKRYGDVGGLGIVEADALDLDALAPFDYLFANHFLHHLPAAAIQKLLADARRLAGRGFVISDLRRSPWSYLGFSIFARIYRDSFTRADGLISIRKGFTPEELRRLAGDTPAEVRTALPGRVRMVSGFRR